MHLQLVPPLSSGVYTGHHRENTLPKGIGLIPLGDRDRVKPTELYLVGNAEEAEPIAAYDKFLK